MVSWLLQVGDFMPHGMCLLWRPGLIALHVVSDALIAAAYLAIPLGIGVFVRCRQDLSAPHRALAALFAIFITACGMTHVMSIVVLWRPFYVAEGVLKAVTAAVSVFTALALPLLIPQLLRIPSPKALAAEIAAHKATLAQLDAARAQLADRVRLAEGELRETTRRFEAALRGSIVTVFEQDDQLRYTWVYNPPMGLDAADLIGRTDAEVFAPETARRLQAIKREALESGEPRREEVRIVRGATSTWLDLRAEPVTPTVGQRRLIAVATDVTALKRQQDHLTIVLRELNHRAKNLLSVVMGIVRQTGRVHQPPGTFTTRLQERLSALADAHDVLVRQNWTGADLHSIVEGALRHQIQTFGGRITIRGAPCSLPAEGAHYMAMALHELGSNAVRYGALSGEAGAVEITWDVSEAPPGAVFRLWWRERSDTPIGPPKAEGFGSRILKALAPSAMNGAGELDFAEGGLCWTLTAPLPATGETGVIVAAA
jgi:PAS domain S-box-containing protein